MEYVLRVGPNQQVREFGSVNNWQNNYQPKWDFNVPLNLLHQERGGVDKMWKNKTSKDIQ